MKALAVWTQWEGLPRPHERSRIDLRASIPRYRRESAPMAIEVGASASSDGRGYSASVAHVR